MHHQETQKRKATKVQRIDALDCLRLKKQLGLSDRRYRQLSQFWTKKREEGRLATLEDVVNEKKKSLPKDIIADSVKAVVPLQSLVDKTAEEIMKILEEKSIIVDGGELVLIGKAGGDGQGMQVRYNQKGDQRGTNFYTQAYVPLFLMNGDVILWENDS